MAIPGLPDAGSHTVFSHQEVVVVQLMLEILLLSVLFSTPIQDALDNVRDNGMPIDSTVYVGPGTYAEQLAIKSPI